MKYIIAFLCIYFINSTTEIPGVYENLVNKQIDYSALDDDTNKISFPWKDFKINTEEKVKKVMVFISTTKSYLGEWSGVFATTTTEAPSYWKMTKDMSKSFRGKTGKVTWEIPDEISEIIQLEYDGKLTWGIWYMDCIEFTIDKIVAFTDTYEGGYKDEEDESDYKKAVKIEEGIYNAEIGDKYFYQELGEDDKMIPVNWNIFTIPKNETITKIKITISTTDRKLGTWVGAFGSATSIPPNYWIMTEEMTKTLKGTKDFVIWTLTADEAKAVKSQTSGQIKFGVWYMDCNQFTVEECTIYTDAAIEQDEEEEKEKEKDKDDSGLKPGQRFGIALLIIVGAILLLVGLCLLRRYIKLKHSKYDDDDDI